MERDSNEEIHCEPWRDAVKAPPVNMDEVLAVIGLPTRDGGWRYSVGFANYNKDRDKWIGCLIDTVCRYQLDAEAGPSSLNKSKP